MHARGNAAGLRLQRLRPADFAAILRDCRVVRHVLRLERADAKAAASEQPAQARDDERLADVGARALEHERAGGHIETSPGCSRARLARPAAAPTGACALKTQSPLAHARPRRNGAL